MVGGYVVVYMNKNGEMFVRFFYNLEEANKMRCNAMITKGYTAKIFRV